MFASEKKLLRGKALSIENPTIKIGTGKFNTYRGEVEFQRRTGSDMTIINVLPIEEYLYGVVPNEMGASSNIEALKAQAIASRSYSYKIINKHSADGFNLCATTDCHVYNGYSSEKLNTNMAINDTKDMVVTYNGEVAETLYFSSSGGKTEAAVNVWKSDIPYLQCVDDKYETGKFNHYNWKIDLTAEEISQKLKSKNIGAVTSIEITKQSEAGRAIEVIVKGTSNPSGIIISKIDCKNFLGLYSQLYTITTNSHIIVTTNSKTVNTQLSKLKIFNVNGKTTNIDPAQQVKIVNANGISKTVSASPSVYSFVGKGWGHSVGMSQDGAIGYANAGYTYAQILTHYYTGTKIDMITTAIHPIPNK